MRNCSHKVHKTCFEDAFEQNEHQNKCRTCQKVILDGLQEALKIPKIKQNKVTVKINKSASTRSCETRRPKPASGRQSGTSE